MPPDLHSLEKKAEAYWTKERLEQTCGAKDFLLDPKNSASLLYQIGLLDEQAHMSRRQVKKFQQVNHMLRLIQAELEDLKKRHAVVRLIDIGCGNSFLTLVVTWYLTSVLKHDCQILGIDTNAKVIEDSKKKAQALGWGSQLRFLQGTIDGRSAFEIWQNAFAPDGVKAGDESTSQLRFHMVIALHACDTATDEALAFAIKNQADYVAAAPCCQAELAQQWKSIPEDSQHPLQIFFKTPNFRREGAAQFTDALRTLKLKACGYAVTVTEFVESKHTPKNRLIKGMRRAKFDAQAEQEYHDLVNFIGGKKLALDRYLG